MIAQGNGSPELMVAAGLSLLVCPCDEEATSWDCTWLIDPIRW